ncbi:MAG: hypothetical protein MUO21_05195, partial [Nitrososphaeraceae archaeon]|nr:hypothetical protein [Nitrososphaeraceae archaeon]
MIILIILTFLTIYQLMTPQVQEKMINVNPSPITQAALAPPRHMIPEWNPLTFNMDRVMQYDYRKAFDPLIDPTRRVPRHELPTLPFKRLIDFPT